METAAPGRSRPNTAWAGIVFAVLYIVGVMTAAGAQPANIDDFKDSPADLAAGWPTYYEDSGHRWTILVGAFFVAGATLALIVFASALRDRLADAGAPTAGRLAFGASLVFAAITLAAVTAMGWIPGAKQFGGVAVPEGELNYLSSQLGFAMLLLGGGAAAALFLVTAGRAAGRTDVVPAWLGWAGVVIGVLVFFLGVMFVPMALFPLWVLITSIVLIRRPAGATA